MTLSARLTAFLGCSLLLLVSTARAQEPWVVKGEAKGPPAEKKPDSNLYAVRGINRDLLFVSQQETGAGKGIRSIMSNGKPENFVFCYPLGICGDYPFSLRFAPDSTTTVECDSDIAKAEFGIEIGSGPVIFARGAIDSDQEKDCCQRPAATDCCENAETRVKKAKKRFHFEEQASPGPDEKRTELINEDLRIINSFRQRFWFADQPGCMTYERVNGGIVCDKEASCGCQKRASCGCQKVATCGCQKETSCCCAKPSACECCPCGKKAVKKKDAGCSTPCATPAIRCEAVPGACLPHISVAFPCQAVPVCPPVIEVCPVPPIPPCVGAIGLFETKCLENELVEAVIKAILAEIAPKAKTGVCAPKATFCQPAEFDIPIHCGSSEDYQIQQCPGGAVYHYTKVQAAAPLTSVTIDKGKGVLKVDNGDDLSMSCQDLVMKFQGGVSCKLQAANQQIQVTSATIRASADKIARGPGDRLILQGNVRLTYKKGSEQAMVAADRIVVGMSSGYLEMSTSPLSPNP